MTINGITIKPAKNGSRIIYANGKRVSLRKAEEIDELNRYQVITNALDSHFPTAESATLKNDDFNPRANNGIFKLRTWVFLPSFFAGDEATIFERGYKNAADAVNALEYLKEYFGNNFKGGHVFKLGTFKSYSIVRRRGGFVTNNTLV